MNQNQRAIFIQDEHDIAIKLNEYYEKNPYGDRKYYGVTSVLSKTKSEDDKAALQKWRDNVGEEVAEEILQESLRIGSSLDMIIEKFLSHDFDESLYKKEDGYRLFLQLKPILKKIKPIGMQIHLYSDKYKIQGFLDCIGFYKDTLYMIDFKNARKEKRQEHLQDYYLQCAMYCIILFEMIKVPIKDICIIVAVRKGIPQVERVKLKDYINLARERLAQFELVRYKKA